MEWERPTSATFAGCPKDKINNKTYHLTVRPHLGGGLAMVIVGDLAGKIRPKKMRS